MVNPAGSFDVSGFVDLFAYAASAAILLIYCYVWAIINWTVQSQLAVEAQPDQSTVHLRPPSLKSGTAEEGGLREDFHFI